MEILSTLDAHQVPYLIDHERRSTKRLKLYNPIVHQNINVCEHPEIMSKMCTYCGVELDDRATLKKAVFGHLLREKKLSLVLDLDNTLLHSVLFERLLKEEQESIITNRLTGPTKPEESSLFKGSLFRTVVNGQGFITKLRPGLGYFLVEASKLFSLHVFTKGSLEYALEMLKLIDPGQFYFESMSRVFTRKSIMNNPRRQKNLDLVIGEPRGTLIVDDQERVWNEKDRENLIVIPGYKFFCDSRCIGEDGKSRLVMGTDESETEGHLNLMLEVLKQIHQMFFDTESEGSLNPADRDVRKLKSDLYNEYMKELREIEELL